MQQATHHDTKLKWKLSPEQKLEIAKVYCTGVPISTICRIFEIDHSTVYYHLKRAQVFQAGQPREIRTLHAVISLPPLPRKKQVLIPTDLDGYPINQGHDYKDYLRIEKEKSLRRLGLIK